MEQVEQHWLETKAVVGRSCDITARGAALIWSPCVCFVNCRTNMRVPYKKMSHTKSTKHHTKLGRRWSIPAARQPSNKINTMIRNNWDKRQSIINCNTNIVTKWTIQWEECDFNQMPNIRIKEVKQQYIEWLILLI